MPKREKTVHFIVEMVLFSWYRCCCCSFILNYYRLHHGDIYLFERMLNCLFSFSPVDYIFRTALLKSNVYGHVWWDEANSNDVYSIDDNLPKKNSRSQILIPRLDPKHNEYFSSSAVEITWLLNLVRFSFRVI